MNSCAYFEMEKEICKIIEKHLNDDQIEENYQNACNKYFPDGGCSLDPMGLVVHECRKVALSEIPQEEFTPQQLLFIRKAWKLNV